MEAVDKFFATREGRLHAHVVGEGPAVILMHGLHPANDWRVWEHNLAAIAEAGYRAYALDLIGYGASDHPPDRPEAPRQAQAVLDLMRQEELEQAIFGGVSWGGGIALFLALHAPERVAGLILVDAAAGRFRDEELARVGRPTLVAWGEDDRVIPVAEGHRLARAIPGARLEVIPDVTKVPGAPDWAGHHPMRFRPDAFNPVLQDFLKRLGGETTEHTKDAKV
ncbi:MAG: alpha/beta fold hydrolase [Anaerolineae bacterium]|nr:alpha/beta fold hydrolase [Anaerolineae bacterium]